MRAEDGEMLQQHGTTRHRIRDWNAKVRAVSVVFCAEHHI